MTATERVQSRYCAELIGHCGRVPTIRRQGFRERYKREFVGTDGSVDGVTNEAFGLKGASATKAEQTMLDNYASESINRMKER